MNFFQRLFKKREEKIFRPATQEEINHKIFFKTVVFLIENGDSVKLFRKTSKNLDGEFEIITLSNVTHKTLHFKSNLCRFYILSRTSRDLEYIVKWDDLYNFLYDWELYE
jgi:hypothetical protein